MTFRPDGDAAVNLSDVAFLFHVTLDGEAVGDFQAVENMTQKYEAYTYKEGGRNHSPHLLLGPASYGEMALRWGLMKRNPLWDWTQDVDIGVDFRKELQIFQLDRQLRTRRRYTLHRAWPLSWKGSTLDVTVTKLPVEELVLAYDYMTLEVHGNAE